MKMPKTLETFKRNDAWILGGIALLMASSVFLVGYENTKMHTRLNERIVKVARKKFDLTASSLPKFANWDFDFETSDVTGPGVTNPGYVPSTTSEGDMRLSSGKWIEHGGFSADEPEMFMALRHFYDPKRIDGGKSYLTNRGTLWEPIANNEKFNPHIDAKEWALTHATNPYRWEEAKGFLKKGIEEKAAAARERLFAQAYRGLGETLHLLADMGCPPHVRNDSHAAPCGYQCRMALGNPDPYEELVTPAQAQELIPDTGGKVLPSLQAELRGAKTAAELFETLSKFTNENFFTGDTIVGTTPYAKDIVPRISGRSAYASPRLESLEYAEDEGTYYKTFEGGQRVKMCKDAGWIWLHAYPYIDQECAASQAAVLLPNVAEAGINLFRLFFPDLQITLGAIKAGMSTPAGWVRHATDDEYKETILYRGTVTLWANHKQVGEVEVGEDGVFTFGDVTIKEGDRIYALITLPGGIFIRSLEQTVSAGGSCAGGIPDGDVCKDNICYSCNGETQELTQILDCNPPKEKGCEMDPVIGCKCVGM
jgi:hypothetical protein